MLLIMFYYKNLKDYLMKLLNHLVGSCLKQDKVIFNHGKVANIFIVYELGAFTSNIDILTI